MSKLKSFLNYFTRLEKILWTSSVFLIVLSYLIFDRSAPLTLIASLLGITSLIFCAKGNPIGQLIMVIFSLLYGIISFSFAYYGEMITYLGMSMPMAIFALVSWLTHPYKGNKAQVKVEKIRIREWVLLALLTVAVTVIFYFILKTFGTASLIVSTFSVSTSFIAVYLTFRRSPYFALGYVANDLVLIVLWTIASFSDPGYISVAVCFLAFLANDTYSFINWKKMQRNQGD
jgi:nicotinamide mononucleotide transporter PnuC